MEGLVQGSQRACRRYGRDWSPGPGGCSLGEGAGGGEAGQVCGTQVRNNLKSLRGILKVPSDKASVSSPRAGAQGRARVAM